MNADDKRLLRIAYDEAKAGFDGSGKDLGFKRRWGRGSTVFRPERPL